MISPRHKLQVTSGQTPWPLTTTSVARTETFCERNKGIYKVTKAIRKMCQSEGKRREVSRVVSSAERSSWGPVEAMEIDWSSYGASLLSKERFWMAVMGIDLQLVNHTFKNGWRGECAYASSTVLKGEKDIILEKNNNLIVARRAYFGLVWQICIISKASYLKSRVTLNQIHLLMSVIYWTVLFQWILCFDM